MSYPKERQSNAFHLGPGGMRLIDVPLDMTFSETLGIEENAVPDAYERLIMDVI